MKQFARPKKYQGKRNGQAKKTRKSKTKYPPIQTSEGHDHILHLQQTIGNQAVQRMIVEGTLQLEDEHMPKGGDYDREIEALAQRVLMSDVEIQPQTQDQTRVLQTKPSPAEEHGNMPTAPVIQGVGIREMIGLAFAIASWVSYSLYRDYLIREENYTKVIQNIPDVADEIFESAKSASGTGEVDANLTRIVAQGALLERNRQMGEVRGMLSYLGLALSVFMKSKGKTYEELYEKYSADSSSPTEINMKIISAAGRANPNLISKFLGRLKLPLKAKL